MWKAFKIIGTGLICMQCFTCNTATQEEVVMPLATGTWRGTLHMQQQALPFIFRVTYDEKAPIIYLVNDAKEIKIDSVSINSDSLHIAMPMFNTGISAVFSDSTMTGQWTKNNNGDYSIPFKAILGPTDRFSSEKKANVDLSARWDMTFIKGQDSTKAIGLFEQQGQKLSGAVMAVTDDYRYLAGIVSEDSIKLSTFDGDNAYLVIGKYENDTLKGDFWSGKYWHEKFFAIKNEEAELPNADTLTDGS